MAASGLGLLPHRTVGLRGGRTGIRRRGIFLRVLVAEELFASGCKVLVSVTSSGQITPLRPPPYFVLIDRAVRDEGTSYHYLPPVRYSEAPGDLLRRLSNGLGGFGAQVLVGPTWTTDAPFRETKEAIEAMRAEGIFAVETEAAALYAFAAAQRRDVVCVAHVTNQMGQIEGDFEKGEADGATASLALALRTAALLGS